MKRRRTREVKVGKIGIGGSNPIRIQSMTTAAPQDITSVVEECVRLYEAGCELTRISTPRVEDAVSLKKIKDELISCSIDMPLSADIHFMPQAAIEAAKHVEKVRINPGNYADKRSAAPKIFSDDEYKDELNRINDSVKPLIDILKKRKTSLRIGVNHGSLSERILTKYGNTPLGMVESAMEYLRIARELDFDDIVLSMKSSNPRIMVQSVRKLVNAMDQEGFIFPLHLGVTEAGEGEDGRIRSAVGIGALLADGIGDTIRVSLAEPPEAEIPVCRELISIFENSSFDGTVSYSEETVRRKTNTAGIIGGENPVRIAGYKKIKISNAIVSPQTKMSSVITSSAEAKQNLSSHWKQSETDSVEAAKQSPDTYEIPIELFLDELPNTVTVCDDKPLPDLTNCEICRVVITNPADSIHFVRNVAKQLISQPLILVYNHCSTLNLDLSASIALGVPLINGYGDAIMITGNVDVVKAHFLAISILQNSLTRISRAEIIACPSCGRTLFDLQTAVKEVKKRFSHYKNVKIAVMGCIVNGIGEMADADFGFVGGPAGTVNLYYKGNIVENTLPISIAYDKLQELIEKHRT